MTEQNEAQFEFVDLPSPSWSEACDMMIEFYNSNIDAGWYHNPETGEWRPRPAAQTFALILTEIGEFFESWRKNKPHDHLPEYTAEAEELADVIIRLFDAAGYYWMGFNRVEEVTEVDNGESECRTSRVDTPKVCGKTYFDCDDPAVLAVKLSGLAVKLADVASRNDEVLSTSPTAVIINDENLEEAAEMVWQMVLSIEKYFIETLGVNPWEVVEAKRAYNAQRADHKKEARLAEGGKKV